jgi:hypothetical protein
MKKPRSEKKENLDNQLKISDRSLQKFNETMEKLAPYLKPSLQKDWSHEEIWEIRFGHIIKLDSTNILESHDER